MEVGAFTGVIRLRWGLQGGTLSNRTGVHIRRNLDTDTQKEECYVNVQPAKEEASEETSLPTP